MSPGDLDGDGYSELFVAESEGAQRLVVFSGGNPHDTIPDMIISSRYRRHFWIPDINGDALDDFAFLKPVVDSIESIEIWFGGPDFLLKTEADLILSCRQQMDSFFGSTIAAGDINGDGQNDIVISRLIWTPPVVGRFMIFYGGEVLDTTLDDHINVHLDDYLYNNYAFGIGVGDINGDGLMDLAYGRTTSGLPGYVSIIFGSVPLDSVPDIVIWSPFDNESLEPGTFGSWIYALGDINRDGFDDFAVTGQTLWPCVFLGGNPFDPVPLILGDTLDHTTQGTVVSVIGDINHDGWDDIGVGYVSFDFGGGIVHIYYGYRDLNTDRDLALYYWDAVPTAGHHFGEYIGPAGDFNGDGVDDIVISSEQYWSGGPDDGNVYVYAGDPNLPTPADEVSEDETLPSTFNILYQNYPNPFNQQTTIRYNLWGYKKRRVELIVYNIMGQRVRTLIDRKMTGGDHIAYWDGTDDFGHSAPTGVYFCVLETERQLLSKKMVYLK